MITVKIYIDWSSLESIEAAEKLKLKLENKGYTQVNSIGGIFKSAIITQTDAELPVVTPTKSVLSRKQMIGRILRN